MNQARSLNCRHPPVSLVGRFRLGGQVLLGIENLSLAPRWAETISTTKADASGQRYKNHLDNSNDSVRFQNLWAGSDFVGIFGLEWIIQNPCISELSTQVKREGHASVAFFLLICTVYAYYVAKMSKIAITRFGGQVRLPKCNGGQVRWFRGRVLKFNSREISANTEMTMLVSDKIFLSNVSFSFSSTTLFLPTCISSCVSYLT